MDLFTAKHGLGFSHHPTSIVKHQIAFFYLWWIDFAEKFPCYANTNHYSSSRHQFSKILETTSISLTQLKRRQRFVKQRLLYADLHLQIALGFELLYLVAEESDYGPLKKLRWHLMALSSPTYSFYCRGSFEFITYNFRDMADDASP